MIGRTNRYATNQTEENSMARGPTARARNTGSSDVNLSRDSDVIGVTQVLAAQPTIYPGPRFIEKGITVGIYGKIDVDALRAGAGGGRCKRENKRIKNQKIGGSSLSF
jgi:hypothetical protein